MFCKHDWEVLSEKFIESNVERLVNGGMRNFQYLMGDLSATHIVLTQCKKCGKIKQFVTKT